MRIPESNLLLLSLSHEVQSTVAKAMVHVDLPFKTSLYEEDQKTKYAYFLSSGLASVVATIGEGTSSEVAIISNEGLIGGIHVLGPATDPAACFMQTNGSGWRIPLMELKLLFEAIPELRSRVLEFVQCYSFVLSKIACCNRLHKAEPRLARWLVMASARQQAEHLPFTHELMGMFVGANRATVTLVLGELQLKGIIENSRGKLFVSKPERLREAACDCLPAIEARINALYSVSN